MMLSFFRALATWLSIVTCVQSNVLPWKQPTLSNVTVFAPPANYTDPRTLYARTVQLTNGDILATWENYSPEPPLVYFPIYRSQDGGRTWEELSRVHDQVKNWGLRYQPDLYILPHAIGGFKAGTVLLSGNAIPTNLSNTQIELYASRDSGKTWAFVSHVAAGGEALPNNGLTPVWEPFVMLYKGELVIYYSDQRDPAHGQKLVHQASRDLRNWAPPVDDVAYPTYTDRPGMPTIMKLPSNKYIYTYEYASDGVVMRTASKKRLLEVDYRMLISVAGGGPNPTTDAYSFPVFYRIANNPLDFNKTEGMPLVATDGTVPTGSPYVTWSPVGGPHGTIVVSSGSNSEIFINQELGNAKAWRKIPTPEGISYTRHLRVLQNPSKLLIMGAGHLPPSTTNRVTVSVIDLSKVIRS